MIIKTRKDFEALPHNAIVEQYINNHRLIWRKLNDENIICEEYMEGNDGDYGSVGVKEIWRAFLEMEEEDVVLIYHGEKAVD
jgi:hypothetical protein